MPVVIKENGNIEITGLEYGLFNTLHFNLFHDMPIDDVLKRIKQVKYSDLIINRSQVYPINLENPDSFSPVHVAALRGNVIALRLLSDAGADFNCFSSEYGKSPLHLAAQYNYPDAIEYLIHEKNFAADTQIQKGIDVQHKDTPLLYCAVFGHFEAAKKLISFSADVNYKNSRGMTPLHYVCKNGFGWRDPENVAKMVVLLLKHGADPTLKDTSIYTKNHFTPVELISDRDHREMINQVIVDFYKKKEAEATKKPSEETKEASEQQVTPVKATETQSYASPIPSISIGGGIFIRSSHVRGSDSIINAGPGEVVSIGRERKCG